MKMESTLYLRLIHIGFLRSLRVSGQRDRSFKGINSSSNSRDLSKSLTNSNISLRSIRNLKRLCKNQSYSRQTAQLTKA